MRSGGENGAENGEKLTAREGMECLCCGIYNGMRYEM